jgi:hypothetical protein
MSLLPYIYFMQILFEYTMRVWVLDGAKDFKLYTIFAAR